MHGASAAAEVKFQLITGFRKKLVHVLCEKQNLHLSAGNLFIDICFLWGGVDITGIIFVFSCEITMTNQL